VTVAVLARMHRRRNCDAACFTVDTKIRAPLISVTKRRSIQPLFCRRSSSRQPVKLLIASSWCAGQILGVLMVKEPASSWWEQRLAANHGYVSHITDLAQQRPAWQHADRSSRNGHRPRPMVGCRRRCRACIGVAANTSGWVIPAASKNSCGGPDHRGKIRRIWRQQSHVSGAMCGSPIQPGQHHPPAGPGKAVDYCSGTPAVFSPANAPARHFAFNATRPPPAASAVSIHMRPDALNRQVAAALLIARRPSASPAPLQGSPQVAVYALPLFGLIFRFIPDLGRGLHRGSAGLARKAD